MLIEEKREIGHTLFVERGTIWPKIVSRERKEREG